MNIEALSLREREVLRHRLDYRGVKEIALILDIADGTVKAHITRILSKTGAGSVGELCRYVRSTNLTI